MRPKLQTYTLIKVAITGLAMSRISVVNRSVKAQRPCLTKKAAHEAGSLPWKTLMAGPKRIVRISTLLI